MPSNRPRTTWTLVLVSAALFMVTLDNLVVTTALPRIRIDLGAPLSGLEWIVNAYTLSFAVLLMTGAALGDRFGRRRMFTIGLSIFTAASGLAALAPTTGALIGATVAILYAPKSGKDTRKYISNKAQQGKEAITESSMDVVDASKEMFERGRKLVEDAAELFDRGRKLVKG